MKTNSNIKQVVLQMAIGGILNISNKVNKLFIILTEYNW